VHDIERLITYVRRPSIFQYLLTFIRTWAQHVGLYGQVYGYLGGYSWAVLCAYICRQFTSTSDSIFSLEQLFLLVRKFFSVYSQFDWSHQSLHLYTKLNQRDQSLVGYRGAMRIQCPSPPFSNSARSTTNSTRQMIIQGFQRAAQIAERTGSCEDTLREILHLSDQFPDQTIQSIIQLTVSGRTIHELHQWLGYVKSRLAHFLTDCEDECHLFVQTDAKVEQRREELERFYSMGFQIDAQALSRHRQFYYTFNKLLDEFKVCPFRTETMKIFYKLTSIHDWRIERTR
jgi:poly(A) polymerase